MRVVNSLPMHSCSGIEPVMSCCWDDCANHYTTASSVRYRPYSTDTDRATVSALPLPSDSFLPCRSRRRIIYITVDVDAIKSTRSSSERTGGWWWMGGRRGVRRGLTNDTGWAEPGRRLGPSIYQSRSRGRPFAPSHYIAMHVLCFRRIRSRARVRRFALFRQISSRAAQRLVTTCCCCRSSGSSLSAHAADRGRGGSKTNWWNWWRSQTLTELNVPNDDDREVGPRADVARSRKSPINVMLRGPIANSRRTPYRVPVFG